MRYFDTGATRDSDETKLDFEGFLSPRVLYRFAEYMHKHRFQADGKMRASDNWQKGIPREAYMKSLTRHFMELWLRHRERCSDDNAIDETLCAILFNVQGLLNERILGRDVGATDDKENVADAPCVPEMLGGACNMEHPQFRFERLEADTYVSRPIWDQSDYAPDRRGRVSLDKRW